MNESVLTTRRQRFVETDERGQIERAKQWLSANGLKITVKLDGVCEEIDPPGRHVKRSSRHAPRSA
jgi:hypothetical protein